jgi:RHS repeat-associated protein
VLAAKYLYDPFGNILAMSGPLMNFNKYRFSSKESDDNSGLYYYGFRFYEPDLQRWVNRDPILEYGFKALQRVSPNEGDLLRASKFIQAMLEGHLMSSDIAAAAPGNDLYIFVQNNPITLLDISGLCPCTQAAPQPDSSPVCNSYGNETYPVLGVNLKCFCMCAGNSAWSQAVRGCLACAHSQGQNITAAHLECYAAATQKYGSPPIGTLAACYIGCGGYVPPVPILPSPPF